MPESTAQSRTLRFGHARAKAGNRKRKAPPGASLYRLRQHARAPMRFRSTRPPAKIRVEAHRVAKKLAMSRQFNRLL